MHGRASYASSVTLVAALLELGQKFSWGFAADCCTIATTSFLDYGLVSSQGQHDSRRWIAISC